MLKVNFLLKLKLSSSGPGQVRMGEGQDEGQVRDYFRKSKVFRLTQEEYGFKVITFV